MVELCPVLPPAGCNSLIGLIKWPGVHQISRVWLNEESKQGTRMQSVWESFCDKFGKVAAGCATSVGTPGAFVIALSTVIVWAFSGSHFHYSDTWQLVINTGTTIVTFLMVFLIQNTQNRDARALHLKLDELIRSVHAAHNDMINIEKLSDQELAVLAKRYERIREAYESRQEKV
jgi:low affinity Fe/Cu permease